MQGMIDAAAAAACVCSCSCSSSSPRFLCNLALTASSGRYNRSSVKRSASSNSITEQEAATAFVGWVIRRVGRGSKLVGCGSPVPTTVISNDDLSKFVDTSDDWIAVRTGIRTRHVLAEGETVTSLWVKASKKALEMANVDPQDIDLLLLCTSTPDDLFGSAPQVQKELGCSNALAFDLITACSGFVLGLVTASRFIKAPICGGYENVLVVGFRV